MIPLKDGDIFSREKIAKGLENLRKAYGEYGYIKASGGADKAADSIRLFMVPGMAHCAGGDGTSTFDSVTVLEQWVEQKKTPTLIQASHLNSGVADRTRPLCPYPAIAAYKGSGDTNDAANFTCK